jgi:phage regulator Rha-like protein
MQTTTGNEMGRAPAKSATHKTTATDDTPLTLQPVKGEPRVDSRVLAQHLGNKHQNVRELLSDYADDFRQFGILRFQTGEIQGRGQPEKYALLNEDQCYLLLTYSRNTPKVRALKVRLVKAFSEARQAQDLSRTDYLPTYHALHDEIHALAAGSANERFVHMNINKLVNKAAGIEAGQRPKLDVPHKSMVIAAQFLASTAMNGAADHKEGYEQAKTALERFNVAMLGVSHA